MCGIAAVVGAVPSEAFCEAAVDSLHHRGPDDMGVWAEGDVWIGHTRLSIIDLSSAGRQPMVSPDGRYVFAYNGEIYNHPALRDFVGDRWQWRGTSDTEVLLALLSLEGPHCLHRVRGMFAFVLWDRQRRRLLAARDHFGIKPLYYERRTDTALFASELRTLVTLGGGREIDPDAVESFLLTGSVRQPASILRGVRAVKPAHYLELGENGLVERPYWRLPETHPTWRPREELVAELDDLLRDSVRMQLRADVPVATFLSGGIDSSLITAFAAEQLKGSLRTFSVGFEARDPAWDETAAAQLVAERYETQHQRIIVSRKEFEGTMDELPVVIDQPSVDGVNSYFVARAAAGEVKVALSGQGGDEFFGGYNTFQFASRLANLNSRIPRLPPVAARLGRVALRLPSRIQHNWYVLGVAGVLTRGDADVIDALSNPLFSPTEIGVSPAPLSGWSNGDLVNAISRRLIRGYLKNTLLRDMDAMSMSHSLEVRVPIVDHVLASFALSIPGPQKVTWGNPKSLLREIARRKLPAELLTRKKQGFVFPLAEWLRHPACRERIDDALTPAAVQAAGLVEPALVRRELSRMRRPLPGDIGWLRAQRVWGLYVLHQWHAHWRTLLGRSRPLAT